ncbi:putative bifunctional diguanylate cyclase/phosphodiesterase [Alteromonas gilva]|uniref:EAL domain-containing protein n=1 Tax=Alteromonas gilva TaxID=2987522 RepID=A0ABT5L5R5_9ALTE|nr:bifunctional diguanylate cyclase/phosphodiesterase [Alteromonas gilva]MDC8831711.1 EAL domain-containing protein [Alteromonas gilva]
MEDQSFNRPNALAKLSGFNFRTIAGQATQISGCCGIAVIGLDTAYRADNVMFYQLNGKAIPVESVELEIPDYDYLSLATMEVSKLVFDGNALHNNFHCIAKQLYIPDGLPVACIVMMCEQSSKLSTLCEPALEIACQRISLVIEKAQDHACPVISTNALLNQKLELLNEIGSISKTGGWEVDLASGALTWTDEMFLLYGLPIGAPIDLEASLSYFAPETKADIRAGVNNVIIAGGEYCLEGALNRADGSTIRVKATCKPRYAGNKVTHIYGALEDVTEQYRLLETEYNHAAYLTAILDNLNDAVVTIDTNGIIITANSTMSTIFGFEADEIVGENVSILMPEPYAKYHDEFIAHYLETGRAKIIGVGRELPGLHKSGRVFPIELSLSEVIQDGQRQFIGIVKDITERKKAMEEIYHAAYFDALTALPNMRSFEIDLAKVLKQASSHFKVLDIYCCLIDMDNFTQYNLSFGKNVGDKILLTIAERLTNVVSQGLKVYRGIGDNFLILSTAPIGSDQQSHDNINMLEYALNKAIKEPVVTADLSHAVTAAISSCRLEASKASYEKINGILSFANKRAKKQGVGSLLTLDKSAFEDYNRYNTISHSFQNALQNDEFYLMLQPQLDAQNRVVGSEALIRWEHPELGFISPAEFIPIAEESDAIIDISNWVLNDVCRLIKRCRELNQSTRIAVNISGRHIVRADFPDTLQKLVGDWQVAPQDLMLEITETTLVSSIDLVRERMEELGQLGFSFSIDDFGTGYSSLSYLKELPISELKIDRYFVDEITYKDDDVPIVNSIIDLAQALKVSNVAEGIENDFQRDYLLSRGCQFFQGYYFSRPLPEKAWLDYIHGSVLAPRQHV